MTKKQKKLLYDLGVIFITAILPIWLAIPFSIVICLYEYYKNSN